MGRKLLGAAALALAALGACAPPVRFHGYVPSDSALAGLAVGVDTRADVIAAGADGVAVVTDIFMAGDVEAAARRLRAAVDAALAARTPA